MAYKVQANSAIPSKEKAASPSAAAGSNPKSSRQQAPQGWAAHKGWAAPRQLVSVPVTRTSALGGLLIDHMQKRRIGTLCFLVNASLLATGDDYRQSCPDKATGDEVVKSIQSILSDHPLDTERIFHGEVRSHGHTKPNVYNVVSFIFHATGLTNSQSTFLKQELLLKHTGRLPVSIPNRGLMPFTLFTEKPNDAAVLFNISTRLGTEAVSAVLSETLGMKPYFVAAIDHKTADKMGDLVGENKPSSLGLAVKRLNPNVTHIALVSTPDPNAFSLLRAHRSGFRLVLEGEDTASAPVMHVNRVYPVIPRSKAGPGEVAAKRTRTESFATNAWGNATAPPPSSTSNPPPSSTPNPASSPTLGAGRVFDREVHKTAAPNQNVANPSFPTAEPQVLVTQQGTGPEASPLVGGVSTVVGARKATGGPEGDVSKNDQKCAKTRSPEEETLSGQKRNREGNPQPPPQDPAIAAKLNCMTLRKDLKALIAAKPRDEDEIGRTGRQLLTGFEELELAIDTQIVVLKGERKTLLEAKAIGDSVAQKEARKTKAEQLLERKESYEKLRISVVAELASFKANSKEAAAETAADRAMEVEEQQAKAADLDVNGDYGDDQYLDAEMREEVMLEDENMEEDASGLLTGPDGIKASSRTRKPSAKGAALVASVKDSKVEKPPIKGKIKGKGKGATFPPLQTIAEEQNKEQEEAAMVVGAATANQQ